MKQIFDRIRSVARPGSGNEEARLRRTASAARENAPAILLMTGTITPPAGMPGTQRNDPGVRRREYLDAFSFYLDANDDLVGSIVFLENSNASLQEFHDLAAAKGTRKTIHLIRCPSDYPAEQGKGFGEFMMIDYGLRTLQDSGAIDATTVIWKVTGRLRIANIADMIATSPRSYNLYCDLRYLPIVGDAFGGNSWMELRIFSFTLDFYRSVLENQYGRGFVLEKEFFTLVLDQMKTERWTIVPRFRRQPLIEGVSGFSNVSYTSSRYRAKTAIRTAARRVAPSLWV